MKVKPQIKHPPVLKVISDVQVNEGGEAIIEPHILTVFDPDSALSDLTIVIEKQPDFGFIENSKPIPGAEHSLDGIPISAFPYIDLVEGYIKYIQAGHQGLEPDKDTIYIYVTDGHLSSSEELVNITIRPVNDEMPRVYADVLRVALGRYSRLDNSTLSIIDVDTKPEHLSVTIANSPKRGVLKKLKNRFFDFKHSQTLSNQDSFTFQDVLNDLIVYVHQDVKSLENDSVSVIVSDGNHYIHETVSIIVSVVDREVPFLLRNLGLEITPGNSSIITNNTLSATDADSPDDLLVYIMTSDPTAGQLLLSLNGKFETLSSDPSVSHLHNFTQADIDRKSVSYKHNQGEAIGAHFFKFNLRDPANNTLINQMFFITVSEDIFPPIITSNKGLKISRNSRGCITAEMLSAVDEHRNALDLTFSITVPPVYGQLELDDGRRMHLQTFLMSDLKNGEVCYVHSSTNQSSLDSFTFSVSDGRNSVLQTFYISVTSPDDSLPAVKISPLTVKEGSRKVITEFEIDVHDHDTKDEDIMIKVIKSPMHGMLQTWENITADVFSVRDIKQGKIYYKHDDSESYKDAFTFLVSDGSSKDFIVLNAKKKNITTRTPLSFSIIITPEDDEAPQLVTNKGILGLVVQQGKKWNTITKNILHVEDVDTSAAKILFTVTVQPRFGYLQKTTNPGTKIVNFTQSDINSDTIQYVLRTDDRVTLEDFFVFSVEDTKPHRLFNNVFEIQWSRISLNSSLFNISETIGLLNVPVFRSGNDKIDSIAFCKVTGFKSNGIRHIKSVSDEIAFEESVNVMYCTFEVLDNTIFQGTKRCEIKLSSDTLLFGKVDSAVIEIHDSEDEPVINFLEGTFRVNESVGYFNLPVIRKGDLSHELSAMCSTTELSAKGNKGHALETGSDFKNRKSDHTSLITFAAGVTNTFCSVQIIDDSVFEEEEKFLLTLSNIHPVGKIGNISTATVVIDGPNDVPQISLMKNYSDVFYSQRSVSTTVLRVGTDLSKDCTLLCGAKIANASGEFPISIQPIRFVPLQTHVTCHLTFDDALRLNEEYTSIIVFLDSPVGCTLTSESFVTYALRKEKLSSVVEFTVANITAKETAGVIQVPISRSGDLGRNSTILCITHDGTAIERRDFEERYPSRRSSLISFGPQQKEALCAVNVYDDEIDEGGESFSLEIISHNSDSETIVGKNRTAFVEIVDHEDATVVYLEKSEYSISEDAFENSVPPRAIIAVMRTGDVSITSKIRISTIDGTASSGLDYHAKSKLFAFSSGERKKNFEIEILYNKRRKFPVYFTVLLGPDEVWNADIGNLSKSTVTVPGVKSTENLILPSIPIVVSLLHYDNVTRGVNENPSTGYPLVCVTACDINYPEYTITEALCREMGINASLMVYSWEIGLPVNKDDLSVFETISTSTIFTSVHHKVLDSVYFHSYERIHCSAQPVDSSGHLGIPLRSKSVTISSQAGFCRSPARRSHFLSSVTSRPFMASLEHVNTSFSEHANKLHIHVEIPHEDGLLPLVSTFPLHNIDLLLTHATYRHQHACSNFPTSSLNSVKNTHFLKNILPAKKNVEAAFPYNGNQCPNETLLLYQHLDLKKCKWSFDGWYSMSELVQLCGGTVKSDFKTRDTDETYLTVLLPLYVTYVFSAAPSGWTTVEHRTELEFSFYYDSFLGKAGSLADTTVNASVNIVRVGTTPDGHMFFEFKTVAKFYGCFVLEHPSMPNTRSYISGPEKFRVRFETELLWSEQTFDRPVQLWRATSDYNFNDYSGYYSLHLIPCVSSETRPASDNRHKYMPCVAQTPVTFDLPIEFQQTNRPKPVSFALETFFQVFNDRKLFTVNPFRNSHFQYFEYQDPFSKGDSVYGRVFWSPQQGLESAYSLHINEVILCAGANGYTPVYDPTGEVYGKEKQYGCLLPNTNVKYKFILLDRHDSHVITKDIQGVLFEAHFIKDSSEFSDLSSLPGVDGFSFKVDPLYEISSSHEWFLHVIYRIKFNTKMRYRRSLGESRDLKMDHGSNIRKIVLSKKLIEGKSMMSIPRHYSEDEFYIRPYYLIYIISLALFIFGIFILCSNKIPLKGRWMWPNFVWKHHTDITTLHTSITDIGKGSEELGHVPKNMETMSGGICNVRVFPSRIEQHATDDFCGTEV